MILCHVMPTGINDPHLDVRVMRKELLLLIDQRHMCHCRSHSRSGAAKGIGAEFLAQKCAHTNNKRVMDSIHIGSEI